MNIAMIGQKSIATGAEGVGGVDRHAEEIAVRLVKMGHHVTVYARARYLPKRPKTFKGVVMHYVASIPTKRLEAITSTFFSTVHAIRQGFDVIHYHGVGQATLAWIPRLFARKSTVIVTFHARDQFHGKWGLFARMYLAFGERAAVWFSHYCITVSHILQVYCRNEFGIEAVYIPNGATGHVVKSSKHIEKFGIEPKKYLVNVGRLVPQKGLHFLIEAFRKIDTDLQLVFVGAPSFTDEYYTRLREMAKGDGRIQFLGFQKGETLAELYSNAFLFVHASEAEGLPLVVLEAMSYGVASLVSDIPENLEAMHGTGFRFKSGDVADLRRKLRELIASPDLARERGEEARAIIDVNFNWDMIAEHTEGVYITARH